MTQRSNVTSSKSPTKTTAAPAPTTPSPSQPHELECLIQRRLQSYAGLKFSRLTVHQCEQGVCLEGLLESNDEGIDLCDLVNQIAGVKAINRVVTRFPMPCGQ